MNPARSRREPETAPFRVCGLVPTYDNPATVERVVFELLRHLDIVVVIDDGSHEVARAVLDRLGSEPGVVLLRHAKNRGKGAAVKTGLREAAARGFTHALQIDADGQHDLDEVPRFVAASRERPEAVVLGVPRFDETRPPLRGLGHRITCFWTRVEVRGTAIEDPQCGLRVYPVAATLAARPRGDRMDYDTEVAVRLLWSGTPVVNLPTPVRYLSPEEGGVSHFRMGADILLITWMHVRLVLRSLAGRLFGRRLRGMDPRVTEHAASHWSELPERGFALGILAFVWLLGLLGRRIARAILWPVVAYYYLTSARARRASRDLLRRVGMPVSERAVFRHLLRFGQVALDRVLFVEGAASSFRLDPGPVELLHELRTSPRGVLLLGAHVGSFEALAGFARSHDLKVTPVVNTEGSRTFMSVLERLDSDLSARLVDLGRDRLGAVFEIRARLERGEHVALLADRCLEDERAVLVPFLGQPARFPAGPYLLAATIGCPVYFVAALYRGDDVYEIRAERFADRVELPRSDRESALGHFATRYAERLEALVRSDPYNWFNFYDFWDLP